MEQLVKDTSASRAPRVVLGVTGSIAAFKAAALASQMVSQGWEARTILTPGAARFVAPLTFEAITGHPAATEVWDEQPGSSRMGHIELGRWADLLLVAPCSAHTLARLALGLADDLLCATALSTRAPLLLAPAMETGMWEHPATQEHVAKLGSRGAVFVGPESGRLASGAVGDGRMAEPNSILQTAGRLLSRQRDLTGLRVLVTAGPTYEPIDPVRFLGNRSSGKMGYAVAEEARDRGAEVLLVSGPTALTDPFGIETIRVETGEEMREVVILEASRCQVVILAAAVADFRTAAPEGQKIKRSGPVQLDLLPTADIAAETASAAPHAFRVGFALETEDLVTRARAKLERKGLALIVANELSATNAPFGSDRNRVTLVSAEDSRELPSMKKRDVATALWDEIVARLPRQHPLN